MPEPILRRVNPEDAVKALNANVRGRLATRTLRMLGVCAITIAITASPAMARGTASGTFTVGIRIQSVPSPVMTPEQLNARNKALYEEQQASASTKLALGVSASVGTTASGRITSPTPAVSL